MLKEKRHKSAWIFGAQVCLRVGLSAALVLSGCGGSKPHAKTAAAPVAPPARTPGAPALPPPVVIGPVEKQSTSILTRSVARVLGFADVGGRTLTVYQDAYSALYGAIQRKNGQEASTVPTPIVYFSPVFVTGDASWTLMSDGKFRIVIQNRFSSEVVRARVWETLTSALTAIGARRESVNVLPLATAKARLKAFGRDYTPEVSKDLSRVVVDIPKAVVPPTLRDGPDRLKMNARGVPMILEFFSTLDFDYSYYVQKVQETSCAFNFDNEYVQNMYIDSSCPKETADVTDAQLAAFEASNPNWTNLGTLVRRVSMPITRCLAGTETERTLRRSSVSCTRSLQSSDGSRSEFQDALLQFAQSTYVQPIANVEMNDTPPSGWNVQAAAAAIAMFGSPDKFAQEINDFNTNVLNKENITDDLLTSEKTNNFLDTLSKFESRDMATSNQTSGGGGGFLFLISFGRRNQSSSNSSSLKEIFSKAKTVAKADREAVLERLFEQENLNHTISNVNGTLKFHPKVTFNVKADADRITRAAQALNTAELGDIVTENDSFSAEFVLRAELSVHGELICGDNRIGFSKGIQEVEWWTSASWFQTLTNEVNAKIPSAGCPNMTVSLWHDAPSGSAFLPPSTRNINVAFFTETSTNSFTTLPFSGATVETRRSTFGPVVPTSGTVLKRIEFQP